VCLVAVPERHPRIVGRIPASHARAAVRAAHEREHVAVTDHVDVRCRALQDVPTLQHPQRLMISDRHRRIVPRRSVRAGVSNLRVLAAERAAPDALEPRESDDEEPARQRMAKPS
jgi:hypothetical protein